MIDDNSESRSPRAAERLPARVVEVLETNVLRWRLSGTLLLVLGSMFFLLGVSLAVVARQLEVLFISGIGLLAALAGGATLVCANRRLRQSLDVIARGRVTDGTITGGEWGIATFWMDGQGLAYILRYAFANTDGHKCRGTYVTYTRHAPRHLETGHIVTVVFDPDEPSNSTVLEALDPEFAKQVRAAERLDARLPHPDAEETTPDARTSP